MLFTLFSSVALHLSGQSIALRGPVEGFVFDAPTGSFRPILGFPGSATFGGASRETFENGWVAPRKDYGLSFKEGQYSVITGLGSDNPSKVALSDVQSAPEGIAWSGDGSLAIFYSRSASWIQIVAGLPGAGTVGSPVDLSSLPGSLSAIAADTTGKQIAIGMAGESGGVYLITDGGAPVPVFTSSKPAALAFSNDGSQLFSVDAAALQVSVSHLANFTFESFPLGGLLDPVAIASKRDAGNRQVVLVAGGNDYLVKIYDAATHEILADVPLDQRPGELRDFGRSSLLLAPRAAGADPLWLFTTSPGFDVFFVPATATASGGLE